MGVDCFFIKLITIIAFFDARCAALSIICVDGESLICITLLVLGLNVGGERTVGACAVDRFGGNGIGVTSEFVICTEFIILWRGIECFDTVAKHQEVDDEDTNPKDEILDVHRYARKAIFINPFRPLTLWKAMMCC